MRLIWKARVSLTGWQTDLQGETALINECNVLIRAQQNLQTSIKLYIWNQLHRPNVQLQGTLTVVCPWQFHFWFCFEFFLNTHTHTHTNHRLQALMLKTEKQA